MDTQQRSRVRSPPPRRPPRARPPETRACPRAPRRALASAWQLSPRESSRWSRSYSCDTGGGTPRNQQQERQHTTLPRPAQTWPRHHLHSTRAQAVHTTRRRRHMMHRPWDIRVTRASSLSSPRCRSSPSLCLDSCLSSRRTTVSSLPGTASAEMLRHLCYPCLGHRAITAWFRISRGRRRLRLRYTPTKGMGTQGVLLLGTWHPLLSCMGEM